MGDLKKFLMWLPTVVIVALLALSSAQNFVRPTWRLRMFSQADCAGPVFFDGRAIPFNYCVATWNPPGWPPYMLITLEDGGETYEQGFYADNKCQTPPLIPPFKGVAFDSCLTLGQIGEFVQSCKITKWKAGTGAGAVIQASLLIVLGLLSVITILL